MEERRGRERGDREREGGNIHQNVSFRSATAAAGPCHETMDRGKLSCLSITYQWKHPRRRRTLHDRKKGGISSFKKNNKRKTARSGERARPPPVSLTLSPPRFLLHQCTLMKGNAPTMNPVVLHARKKEKKRERERKKITTCFSTVTKKKKREKETGDQVRARGLQSAMEKKGKKNRGQKHRSVH